MTPITWSPFIGSGNIGGAIAKSNYTGCRYREPVYRTLRELALSYFEGYFNLRRERTLRTFSNPVNMARFDHLEWMITDKPLWFVAEYLLEIRHFKLINPVIAKHLHRLDDRSFRAGCLGRGRKAENLAILDRECSSNPVNASLLKILTCSGDRSPLHDIALMWFVPWNTVTQWSTAIRFSCSLRNRKLTLRGQDHSPQLRAESLPHSPSTTRIPTLSIPLLRK